VCARHNHPTQLRGDSDTFFLILSLSLTHSQGKSLFFSVGNWLDARGVRAAYHGTGAGADAGWIRARRQLRGGCMAGTCKGEIGAQIMQGEQPKNRTRARFFDPFVVAEPSLCANPSCALVEEGGAPGPSSFPIENHHSD
jgi:hypothetical protein